MFTKPFVLLVAIAAIGECYHTGVKGGSGHSFKSYGGYFQDTSGLNQADHDLANSETYHRPIVSSYQPYGWNFNQPTRTYGGINVIQSPRYGYTGSAPSGFGWTNSGWNTRINPSPVIPQLPSLFQPNFVPPVYYSAQYPLPNFGSYPNLYPAFNPGFGFSSGGIYPPVNGAGIVPGTGISTDGVVSQPAPNSGGAGGAGGGGGGSRGGSGGSGSSGSSSGGGGGGGSSVSSSSGTGGGSGGGLSSSSSGGGGGGSFSSSSGGGDQVNSASNQGGVYALPAYNPFYPPPINNDRSQDRAPVPRPTVKQPEQDSRDQQHQPSNSIPQSTSPTVDFTRFPTDSLLTENRRREWTEDDEMRWQATTKAPYFENKAPGLDCTLPAAAVLGAQSAMRVSSLLPLNVPIGKPILSCNATELQQAQVRLNGKIYDCRGSSILFSCPLHECEDETLECDVNMRQLDAFSVTCTNGTLISNSHIVCESATLTAKKNILNCFYKAAVSTKFAVPTTRGPLPRQTPAPVSETIDENSLEIRYNTDDKDDEDDELMPQVRRAMKDVFPHDLLVLPAEKFLPLESRLQPELGSELRKEVDGVFRADLLASSQTQIEGTPGMESPRSTAVESERISENWRDQVQSRWEVDSGVKGGPSGTKTKISQRFGEDRVTQPQFDLRDRHVFSD